MKATEQYFPAVLTALSCIVFDMHSFMICRVIHVTESSIPYIIIGIYCMLTRVHNLVADYQVLPVMVFVLLE